MTDDTTTDETSTDDAMSPADATSTDDATDADDATSAETTSESAEGDAGNESRLAEFMLKGALVLLALLALIATLQFYLSAQTAIGRWVEHEYRPIFLAAFNLVVLLASGIGITLVLRRLTE